MGGFLFDSRKIRGKRGYLALFHGKPHVVPKEDPPGPIDHLLPMDVEEEPNIRKRPPQDRSHIEPLAKRKIASKRNTINFKL